MKEGNNSRRKSEQRKKGEKSKKGFLLDEFRSGNKRAIHAGVEELRKFLLGLFEVCLWNRVLSVHEHFQDGFPDSVKSGFLLI